MKSVELNQKKAKAKEPEKEKQMMPPTSSS